MTDKRKKEIEPLAEYYRQATVGYISGLRPESVRKKYPAKTIPNYCYEMADVVLKNLQVR